MDVVNNLVSSTDSRPTSSTVSTPIVKDNCTEDPSTSGTNMVNNLCGAIFLALPQYNMDIIGVLLLVWLQKDTNCQSELKPVFINTGVHMFTSCNIILVFPLTKATLSFYTLRSSTT